MNKFRLVELVLIGFFILLTILQITESNVSTLLLVDLFLVDLFWIYALTQTKNHQLDGFRKKNITEKLIISSLCWGIALNISKIPFSTILIDLSLLVLAVYILISGIKQWISNKKSWFSASEKILGGIVLLGFFMRFKYYPGAGLLRVISLSALSLLMLSYSIISIVGMIKNNQTTYGILLLLFYWGLSACINFILFDSMFWAGSENMFIPGFVFTAIVSLIILIKWIISDNNGLVDSQKLLIYESFRRIIIYGSICLLFYFLTPYQYFRFDFGNRPELINAYIKWNDSNNTDMEMNCAKFQELNQKRLSGQYHEGDEK
jgi:hypothetical protein